MEENDFWETLERKTQERGVYLKTHTHVQACKRLEKKLFISGRLVHTNCSQIQFELVISNRL